MSTLKLTILQTALENKLLTYGKMKQGLEATIARDKNSGALKEQMSDLEAHVSATKELLNEIENLAPTVGSSRVVERLVKG